MVPPVAGCVWIIAKQTRLSVSAGAPDHCSGGERSYPSQENRRGMVALSATALQRVSWLSPSGAADMSSGLAVSVASRSTLLDRQSEEADEIDCERERTAAVWF